MSEQKFCSYCGRELDEWDLQEDYRIHTVCGYGSRHDCSEIDLTLCCSCFDDLVDNCLVSPVVREVPLYD